MKHFAVILRKSGLAYQLKLKGKEMHKRAGAISIEGHDYRLDPLRTYNFPKRFPRREVTRIYFAEARPLALSPFSEDFDDELAEVVRAVNRDHTLRDILETGAKPFVYLVAGIGLGGLIGIVGGFLMARFAGGK